MVAVGACVRRAGAVMTHELVERVISEGAFRWKRFRVCLLCYWHLRHWPMDDLSDAEWRFQIEGQTAYEAFLEGWCRD